MAGRSLSGSDGSLCLIYKKCQTKLNKTTVNNDTSKPKVYRKKQQPHELCQGSILVEHLSTAIHACLKPATTHYLSQNSILVVWKQTFFLLPVNSLVRLRLMSQIGLDIKQPGYQP